ncbi:hypothetical protein EMA8858_01011 [Emticicia aquatica]|uniref:DivIVA domain-containing protein n=1 Tax=Emticicia aquatica TaxID=1681835 RepID=A0ABM9AMZ0_9BACT|nr:DivIVA domain-containing protein [Emticicia aquatica]CAH0994898.1 hypothetical protein EMA8858_01011 [Emticicia aquatica]
MKITPLEIRQHEFEKTFRGYNIEEVDSFLANLSQEWERVLNESKMLRMQLEIAEKEANKLREIEMTLFKTLKTAEDTSTMITEQANQQADKYLQEAKILGEKTLIEAQQRANDIIRQAESRAKYIKDEVLGDVKVLERDFRAMDHYKTNLLVQMRSLSNATLDHVQRFEEKFDKEGVEAKFKEATSLLSGNESQKSKTDDVTTQIENRQIEQVVFEVNEPIVEEEKIEETLTEETTEVSIEEVVSQNNAETEVYLEDSLAEETVTIQEEENEVIEKSVEDSVILETKVNTFSEEPVKNSVPKDDELEVIEGIGPKIAMVLYDAGIFTFRDLAITPVYKIQEILDAAGPQFASHDPSTWTQQAKLAAEGRWADLEALKFYLVGGREPKKDEVEEIHETIEENEIIEVVEETKIVEEPEIEIPVIEEVIDTTPSFTAAPIQSENNLDSITEEMLEKVNKVKAAIRKAMVEKNDGLTKDTTPLPTVNDIIAKNESSSGSSFFDNL